MQILARDFKLVISSWLATHVTLEQSEAFALASVPVLTVVVDWRALNLVTSDFESHDRVSVWLCPVLEFVLYGCIIANVLCVWLYSGTVLLCFSGIFVVMGTFPILYPFLHCYAATPHVLIPYL